MVIKTGQSIEEKHEEWEEFSLLFNEKYTELKQSVLHFKTYTHAENNDILLMKYMDHMSYDYIFELHNAPWAYII